MEKVLSPELIQLIEGLKPYLGFQGQSLAETVLKVANALSSQPVREAYQEVSCILPQLSEKIFKPLSEKFAKPPKRGLGLSAKETQAKAEEDALSKTPVKAKQMPGIQEFFTNNFSLILFLILILLFFSDGGW